MQGKEAIVIAITREFATLGSEVALAVARELNLVPAHDEVINAVAQRMNISPSLLGRYMDGSADQLEVMALDPARVAAYVSEQVFGFAAHGNRVISGCGATYLLRVPAALLVRVRAAPAVRAGRLLEQHPALEPGEAQRQIALVDALQARNALSLFNVLDALDATSYDCILDTGSDSVADCVAEVARLWRLGCHGELRKCPDRRASARLQLVL